MINHSTRHSDRSEIDIRLDWWLREYGRGPTRVQLLRIRAYQRAERRAARLAVGAR